VDSSGDDAHRVYFGGKKDCVHISVPKESTDTIANLNNLLYDERCVLGEHVMQPGKGTITMLKTALSFVLRLPLFSSRITSFELTDKSTITCEKGIEIPLSTYYIAKAGKTWYESKFKARLSNPGKHDQYRQAIRALQTIPSTDIERLIKEYIQEGRIFMKNMKGHQQQESLVHILRDLAKNRSTMMGVLKVIVSDYDCLITEYWLHRYISDMINIEISQRAWSIPVSAIKDDVITGVKIESMPSRRMYGGGFDNDEDSDVEEAFYPYGKGYDSRFIGNSSDEDESDND
jgi:hypothetical protein